MEIEHIILKAFFCEDDRGKIKEWISPDGRVFGKTEEELFHFFGQDGWTIGSVVKMPARSDKITEVYKYYFWRPKQKQKKY